MRCDVGVTRLWGVGFRLTGQDELPPGQSAFISSAGAPSPRFCDQVGLFNGFRYKNMPPA